MEKLNIPELNGNNYHIWAIKIKSALSLKRLDSLLTEVKPETLNPTESSDWDRKNADCVAYIKLSLSDEHSLQFASEENAKLLWEKIKETFIGSIEDRKIDAGNELKNLEMKINETVTDYVARARGISTKCLALGLQVSSRELVYYTVRGLRGKFSRVREILKTQREKTMEDVLEILREEEASCSQSSRNELTGAEAFYVKKNKNFNPNNRLCYVCRRPNHVAKDCFYRNNQRTDRSVTKENRNRNFSKNQKFEQNKNKNSVFSASDICNPDSDNIWILDSGATSHMCNNKYWFNNIIPENQDILLAGKCSKIISVGVGDVKARTSNRKNCINLTIKNVNYVPELRFNLLSVACLMNNGCKIISKNNCLLIFDKFNNLVTKAYKNDNRFEVYLLPDNNSECYIANKFNTDFETWHARLCHLNPKYMNKMKEYVDINVVNNFDCETCKIGKITRKNHPTVNVEQSSEILELIHGDLCGPMQTESYGGAKYFMLLVDDFSGMYFTYFLKNKSEVLEIFTKFKAKYENLTGKKIKRFRSDNGTEWVNNQMSDFLENSGIFHEKTVRYNSESNGKSERGNRILLERARILLYESQLPFNFWAEAINFSTHISNVTPRKGKEKIPLEIWTGKKPNLNYLKKFGCVAYFHIPKIMRKNKFDIPGEAGIMLGYSRNRRAYRIFDIKNKKVIEERSVKFNESLKGSTYLKGDKNSELNQIESLDKIFSFPYENENNQMSNKIEISSFGKNESEITGQGQDCVSSENETEDPSDSRGERILRRSERLKNKQLSVCVANNNNIPNNYAEARNSVNWDNWEIAMKNELDSLNKHQVWEIVEKPENAKLIKSKWVYSLKKDDFGKIKYKARLVAAGFNQIKNKDYCESFSPVVNSDSFRTLLAISAKLNLFVKFFDVKTAYLYSDLEEIVYLQAPPGFEELIGDGHVCKLNKSIYGLPQSGRNWYLKIKSELQKMDLIQLASDNCVFMKTDNNNIFIMCMYVDDLAIFCNNHEMYENFISKIKNVFELHENINSKFLGMEIVKHENGISLSQTEYIESLLIKHNLQDCKSAKTPIVRGEDKSFPSSNDFIDTLKYQELIGELLYLANKTRPDISFAVTYLSQFNQKPEKRHYNLAKRVLRYLKGTKDKKLFYSNEFGFLNAVSDASWGNAENGKSFSGEVILLGKSLISWKCNKQKSVSLSTCEAELFSISETCKDIIWIKNLLCELKCEKFVNDPVILNSDSQAAIQWIKCARSSNKSRHMNLRFHFVKDLLEENVIKVEYVQTEYIIADFLTKAVNEEKLHYSMKNISLIFESEL